MSEVVTLSVAEVVKLFERKVNEAITLLETTDLADNERQEVVKFWQLITARVHNYLKKFPTSNHGDHIHHSKQVSSNTGKRRGRRKSNRGKSMENMSTQKLTPLSTVDDLSSHPRPPTIPPASSSPTIAMVTPHLTPDLHLGVDSSVNIDNNVDSQGHVHHYCSSLPPTIIDPDTEILRETTIDNSQYSETVAKYINMDSVETNTETLTVLAGSSYHDNSNQDVTCSQSLVVGSRLMASGFEGVACHSGGLPVSVGRECQDEGGDGGGTELGNEGEGNTRPGNIEREGEGNTIQENIERVQQTNLGVDRTIPGKIETFQQRTERLDRTKRGNIGTDQQTTLGNIDTEREVRTKPGNIETVQQTIPGNIETVQQTITGQIESVQQSIPGNVESVHQTIPGNIETFHQTIPGKIESVQQSIPGNKESVQQTKPTHPGNKRYPQRIRVSARLKTLYEYTDTNSDDDEEEEEEEGGDGDARKGNKENVKKKKKKEEEEENVTCHVCGIKLLRTSSLIVHMRQHTGVRPFRCSFCERTFTTKANMQRHEDGVHRQLKPFTCHLCPRSFGEKKTLTSHMTTHSGERPYRCPICDQGFAQRGTMKHHMYRHTNYKGHLCDLCGKSFRQKTNLLVHQRRHVNQRKFSCDVCDKSFFTKGDLSRHNSRHTKLRPYICDLCPKSFKRLQYLREHQNIHKGEKPFVCAVCQKSFHDWGSLYRHKKSHAKTPSGEGERTLGEGERTVVLTNAGQKFSFPVSTLLGNQSTLGDVYQITYLDGHQGSAGVSEVTIETGGQLLTEVRPTGGIDLGEVSEARVAVANITGGVQVPEGEGADFSAINLLAQATTQHVYHDD